jgi:hypothetical protein
MDTFNQISASINPPLYELAKLFWSEGAGIASGILILALTIKLTFVGVAVIQGRNLFEELSAVFVRLGIIVLIVYLPVFQPIFMKAIGRCETAGKAFASKILAIAPTKVTSQDPVEYWTQWSYAEVPGAEGKKYTKFSFPFALSNFWGFSNGPQSLGILSETMKQAGEPGTGVGFMDAITRLGSGDLSGVYEYGKKLVTGWGIFSGFDKQALFSIIFMIVGLSFFLLVATTAIAAIVGVGIIAFFAALTAYIGPVLLFSIVMGLGLAAMPLVLFDRYKDLWYSYLIFLSSIPLCIFFYFVFSATGYVVADSIYRTAFDVRSGDGLVTRHVRSAVFGGAPNDKYIPLNLSTTPSADSQGKRNESVGMGNAGQGVGTENILSLLEKVTGKNIVSSIVGYVPPKVFEFIVLMTTMGILWLVSVAITASVATLGIAFASLAPSFAFAWHQAFLNQEIITFINSRLDGIQGALMSGLGTGLAQGGQALQSAGSALVRGGFMAAGAVARMAPMAARLLRRR